MAEDGIMDAIFGGLKQVGSAGVDIAKTVAQLPLTIATLPTDFIKNPNVFLGGGPAVTRGIDIGAILSKDYRRQKEADLKGAADFEKMRQNAEAVKFVDTLFGNTATDTAQGERRKMLEAQGFDPAMLQPLANAAKAERHAARRGAGAAGMAPEIANIADINAAQQAGQTRFASDRQLKEIGAQGAETRRNQGNASSLERSNMYAREAEQFQRGKQTEKMKNRLGRKDDRIRGRAFEQALPTLLQFEQTPEGQAAMRTNPALRNTVAVTKSLLGAGKLPPKLAEEAVLGIVSSAQKGATAQGTPEQFGMSPSVQTQIDKDLIAAQDLGMKAESVLATYDPSWSTLAGKGKLKVQGVKDVLTGQRDPNIANFRAWQQSAGELYSRNKLELTGQASNAQESAEIQRVVPNPDDLGPTQIQAALESFRANAVRKQGVLSKMKQEGRVELTTLERDYLNVKTLLDLKRSGVVSDVAFKSFFGRLTPDRRRDLLNLIKAEQNGAQQ